MGVLTMMTVLPVSATSGKLKGGSIISCGDTYYGHHGDGHWHVAADRGSGWYPQGGSLGYDNPCGGNVAQSRQEDTRAQEQEAKRIEDERVAAETAAAKQLEEERKIKEAEEAKAKEIELEKLNNTSIDAISFGGTEFGGSKSKNASPLQLLASEINLDSFSVATKNGQATSTISFEKDLKPFMGNTLKVKVQSENKEKDQIHDFKVFIFGTAEEFVNATYDAKISYGKDKTIELTNTSVSEIRGSDLNDLSEGTLSSISVNGYLVEDVSYQVKQEDEIAIKLYTKDGVFFGEIPLKEKNTTGETILGAAILTGAGAGGYALIRKRKKAKINV